MVMDSPTLHLSLSNKGPTKKTVTLIILVVILMLEFMFISSVSNETFQDSKIVYSEKATTPNSKLAYGNSGTLELEPFSGKTLQAYKVPYSSQEIKIST